MKIILILSLISFNAFSQERICTRYENVEVEECTSNRASNAIGGALLGGLAGYALGGRKGAGWGGALGGGAGLASGEKRCTRTVEKHCVEYKEVVTKKVKPKAEENKDYKLDTSI